MMLKALWVRRLMTNAASLFAGDTTLGDTSEVE